MAKPAKVIVLGDTKDAERSFKRLNKAAGRVEGNLSKISKKMAGVAKVAAKSMVAVGVAIGAVAVKGIFQFAGFQKQMNEVFTLLPDISGDAMDALTGQVKDFAKEFGTLPDKVIPSLYQAISAGVPRENVFTFLETAQKAAIGGVTDLETAVDGISSVVNAYGAEVIDAAKASDLMFTAVRLGKTNFEELSRSLFNVLPTAADLGIGFDTITAAIANMTAMGTPTSVATTQMRAMLVELAKDGSKVNKAFTDIAGQGFREFIDGGGDLAGAIAIIEQAAQDNGVALSDMFGSVEAGAAALALGGDNAADFQATLAEMEASAGATQGAFDTMDQGLSRSFDKIKASVSVALVNIGENLAPMVEKFADAFQDKLPAMIIAAEELFANIADFVATRVVPAFQVLAAWWADNGPEIVTAIRETADTVVDFVDRALAPLIAWWADNGPEIVTAVDEMSAAIREFVEDTLERLSAWWADNGPRVLAIVESIRSGIESAFNFMVEKILWAITNWEKLKTPMKIIAGFIAAVMIPHWIALGINALISAAHQVKAWAMAKVAALKSITAASVAIVKFIAKWALLGAKSLLAGAKVAAAWLLALGPIGLLIAAVALAVGLIVANWDTIKAAALAAKDWIVDKFTAVVDFFKELPEKIRTATASMFDGIRDAFKSAVNWLIRKWNNLELGFSPIKLPGFLGGGSLSLPKFRTPNIPEFHQGGVFRAPTPGGVGLALLRDREEVTKPGQGRGIFIAAMHVTVVDDLRDPGAGRRFIVKLARDLEAYNRELA